MMERVTETMTKDLNDIRRLFSTSPTSFRSKIFYSKSYLQRSWLGGAPLPSTPFCTTLPPPQLNPFNWRYVETTQIPTGGWLVGRRQFRRLWRLSCGGFVVLTFVVVVLLCRWFMKMVLCWG
ncbi:hypothetical protein Hanom_Chr17g01565351 [Helianthus anomalus]